MNQIDLLLVEQQLSISSSLWEEVARLVVRFDVCLQEEHLPIDNAAIPIREVDAPEENALDLAPHQADPRLVRIQDLIIEPGPAIVDGRRT